MEHQEIYQKIAQTIVKSIPETWQVAEILVRRLEKYIGVKGMYESAQGNISTMDHSLFGYSFSLIVHDLYEQTSQSQSSNWNTLKFRLSRDGKYQAQFFDDKEWEEQLLNSVQ